MHEIIHLQFGPRSNHVGTHLWNIAESQFSYGAEGEVDYGLDVDVDWRQGLGKEGEDTFMPRLILADLKENFGALPNINALYGTTDEEAEAQFDEEFNDINYDIKPQKLRTADAIPPSSYQTFLSSNQYDEEEPQQQPSSSATAKGEGEEEEPQAPKMEKTDYWSDYNRVYYHPRTMNPLSGVFRRLEKGEESRGVSQRMGGWGEGRDAWEAGLQSESTILDNFRHFAEEADLLQGLQLSVDMSTGFASFGAKMVEEFRDEYPKGEVLGLGFMGELLGGDASEPLSASRGVQRTFTEAQYIRTLLENSTLLVPIQSPEETWLSPPIPPFNINSPNPLPPTSFQLQNPGVNLDISNPYQTSALLSTLITSSLLPLRLKSSASANFSLPTLIQKLNWRGDTRIAHLSGLTPLYDVASVGNAQRGWDFSIEGRVEGKKASISVTPFAAQSVVRGGLTQGPAFEGEMGVLREGLEKRMGGLKGHLLQIAYVPAPLPLSAPFPSDIFPSSTPIPPTTLPLLSTLSTSTATRHLLSSRTNLLSSFLARHGDMRMSGMGDGWGRDEGRELVEELLRYGEGFGEEADEESEEDRDD